MKYKINLLSEKEISIFERIIYFFLHYLRYIIVITQLIVIMVFFYRFRIDQSIIDLKESVDQKKEIIEVVMPLLKQASEVDRRTREIIKIIDSQKLTDVMVKYLLSIFPQEIYLSKLEIEANSMKLEGTVSNPNILQSFYAVLKKDAKFDKVDLQRIKKLSMGYSFALNLEKFKE